MHLAHKYAHRLRTDGPQSLLDESWNKTHNIWKELRTNQEDVHMERSNLRVSREFWLLL